MPLAITVALIIATIKGSMVARVFMHLSHEKKWIYGSLLLTVVFFIVLLFVPLFTIDGRHRHADRTSAAHGRGARGALTCRSGPFTWCSSRCRSSWPRLSRPGRSGSTASTTTCVYVGAARRCRWRRRRARRVRRGVPAEDEEPVMRMRERAMLRHARRCSPCRARRWRARSASARATRRWRIATNMGIFFMLGVVGGVLAAFAAFFVYLTRARRSGCVAGDAGRRV